MTLVSGLAVMVSWPFLPGASRDLKTPNPEFYTRVEKGITWFMVNVFILLLCLLMASNFSREIRGVVLVRDKWQSTNGRILQSYVWATRGTAKTKGGWAPKIEYEYFYDGRRYTSTLIDLDLAKSNRNPGDAQAIIAAHPVGKKVTVYVESGNPNFAVLYPHQQDSTLILFGICATIGIGALGGIVHSIRLLRQCLRIKSEPESVKVT